MKLKEMRDFLVKSLYRERGEAKKKYDEEIAIIRAKEINLMNHIDKSCIYENGKHHYLDGFCHYCGKYHDNTNTNLS